MMSALIGVVMGFIAFTVDGLIDKLNAVKFGTVTSLIHNGVSAFPSWVARPLTSPLLSST